MKTNLLSNLSNGLKKGTGLTQVGYRQGTGKVQAGEKQACGRKESLAWSPVELISDEGAIEHPLITHSAPFGIRWKPAGNKQSISMRSFTRLAAMVTLLLTLACGNVWGAAITNTLSSFANKTGTSTGGFKWSADGCSSSRLTTSSGGGVVLSMNSSDSIITELVINLGQSSSGTTLKNNLCEIKVSSDGSSYSDVNFSGGDAITNTSSTSSDLTFTNRDSVNAKGYDKTGQITISFTTGYRYVKLARLANNFIVTKIKYTADKKSSPACTAPDHVNVTGRWDRFAGETINLTATAYDGSDAEIAAANITGYQWQKLEGSTWTNVSNGTVSGATTTGATAKNLQITNCGAGNSGKYRCVVSTGATCSTASATATDGTEGFGVKVYVLECYTGGTTEHHFTRTGDSQAGTLTMTLTANTAYTFKVHADNTYYGNNGTINKDEANWVMCNSDNGGSCASNLTVNSGLGGTFTFGIEYSTSGSSSVEGEPEISVTYPRKTIYLVPNSDWTSNSAKFAFYYYGNSGTGWTDFLTSNDCGMSAEIPQWNGLKVIAVRFNSSEASPGWNGDGHVWNQTGDITATADKNCVTITDWNAGTYGTFATPTYTISYNAGTGGSGSKASESKTCGVDFTLPNSAVFTRTGYTQTGWAISDGGSQAYALGGTYTTNEDKTFYPVWTVNNYDLTWNLDGGTTTSAGTGIASGVSANTTSSVAYGTSLTAPTVTKTGYNFSAWSPSVASTMPAAHTTYTATWTAKTTTITIDANTANHGSTAPSPITATYGSALPSFTAAAGESGWSLTGYYTAATAGTKIINADGTLVASTSYADGSGNWNSEVATLTLYAQYEAATPTVTAIWPMVVNSAFSAVGTANNASITPSNATKAGTNIGDFNTVQNASYTDYTGKMAKIPATGTIGSSGSVTDDHYIKYTITVASGYTFKPTGFSATVGRFGTDNAYAQAVLKTGATTIKSTEASKPNQSGKSVAKTVYSASFNDASTYAAGTVIDLYIYLGGGMASDKSYGIVAVSITGEYAAASCSAPAAPTAFSAGSITSTGATFSITDAADAASYDIYYATSSTAPTASTPATTTSTSKTKAVTGLTASTTYYAWVRSVCDADHKSAWVALGTTSFTTAAAAPAGDCDELAVITATSSSALTATVGSVTYGSMTGGDEISIDGYSYSVKFNSSGHVDISPKAGETFAAGDSLIVVIYNHGSSAQTIGFKIGSNDYTASTAAHALHYFRQTLVAANISDGKVIINRSATNGSSGYIVAATIKRCGLLPSCTTPVLPTLSNQTVCPGSDIAAWDATQTASLETGETATYSWKKKGSETVLGTSATLDLGSSATESQSGTYVVTVTVSADGKASKSASKEVTLTVTAAVEEPSITASKVKVYPGDAVTLTATCGTVGVTWQWYTCTNAAGDGESAIAGEDENAYTIASAGSVGTYYYKVKATGSCASVAKVYTLNVLAADACDKEFWFAKEADRPTGAAAATHITGCPSGSSSASYTASIDGTNYTITGCTGQKTGNVTITVPADNTGTLYVVVQGSSSRTITLSKGGTQIDQQTPTNSVWGVYTVSDLDAGTYTLVSSGNISWGIIALKLCPTISCSDATPTATATNTTVCAGGTITITATGYEDGATFQWQKQNASTNAWENITDSTRATLCYASATSDHAGNYQVVATKTCARTSNTVTIAVPSVPDFGSTVPASVTVMQTIALSISTVEASDAVSYKWYKSANNTLDASDLEIGDSKNLIKAYDGEAIASPAYYVFCIATNSCGADTTSAIAINVTAYVEQDCATRGNEGEAEFEFDYGSAGQGTYSSTACWTMNSNSKFLTYTAPEGKYFKTAKVTIASSSESRASYNWSTDGGSTYTAVALTVNSTLTERTIDLSAKGNVNSFQIGRNFNSTGSSGGTLYVSKICFEYIDACTATTTTPSSSSVAYTMGGDWTNPTFTLAPAVGTLTYSSSNEDIATVDDDGAVNFQGMAGTVTITASYAGDATYCASQGSYIITVSCPGGAPKIVPDGTVNMSGCNGSITLNAKKQDGTAFSDGTYQWYRNGGAISGATSASYIARQAGTYTVERTYDGCTSVSSNSAIVTSETTEPEVERLVPFQYYHVDKTYSDQMKMRHLFTVKESSEYGSTGKNFKMELQRDGGDATDVTTSNAFSVVKSNDNTVDTVMIDLNKLSGKYAEGDKLLLTCKAVDCNNEVSNTYKDTITIRVIGSTPTLALICSGADGDGTRTTKNLVVGGDFLTGYNKADLCVQTGNTSFDASQEWGLYTKLKNHYIVTPVNGYAEFNKLNYEPFDVLLLTDYPKSSKSEAAQVVIDDMAALCDYRPLLSFKTHFQSEKWKKPNEDGDSVYVYTKWTKKGFTTPPVVTKSHGKLNLNIVCYAHPMFGAIKNGEHVYRDNSDQSQLVYTMLTGEGHEGKKGMQGFEIDAAENFVTIGLTHFNATIATNNPSTGLATWTPGDKDRMLVTVAERQANLEARMILFSLNCGAQSKLTAKGDTVVMKCLEYLISDAANPLTPKADCSFTFDNGAGAPHNADWYKDEENCPGCSGELGDGLWTTEANWGPDRINEPGEFTSVRIAASVEVDDTHAHVLDVRVVDGGSITIPAGKALEVKGTIRHLDGSEISPTGNDEISIGSASTGNGTLIFNNNTGDTKARVAMYSNAPADIANMSAATSVWQYIGTPHTDVANARSNYYGSWIYQYGSGTWEVIPNGGPLEAFRGYCITNENAPIVYDMKGTLAATTLQDISIPAGYTVIANSWVAPIDISTFTDDDMENISDKTIYFFNTGTDADGNHGTGTEAGTYVAVPKNSASYVGTWQIPSMQGFYISTSSAGTLHLDYDRHVRPHSARTIVGNKMYAPRRAATESEEPNVLKIFARGSRYQDKLVVLEREDFTRGYDSGWDGEAWGGGTLSPMVYVTGEGREDAVSAIPEFEGTVIAFKAGEDSEYRLDFVYDGEESLYLLDIDNNTYTQIMTGNAYAFTTNDKSAHSRFVLTRKAPQIATGIEPTSDSSLKGRAKKLLIDDKMYILLNGTLYDATGKMVK